MFCRYEPVIKSTSCSLVWQKAQKQLRKYKQKTIDFFIAVLYSEEREILVNKPPGINGNNLHRKIFALIYLYAVITDRHILKIIKAITIGIGTRENQPFGVPLVIIIQVDPGRHSRLPVTYGDFAPNVGSGLSAGGKMSGQ